MTDTKWLSEDERRLWNWATDPDKIFAVKRGVVLLCERLATERQRNAELRTHVQKQEQRYLAALADSDNEIAAERQKVAELVAALEDACNYWDDGGIVNNEKSKEAWYEQQFQRFKAALAKNGGKQ